MRVAITDDIRDKLEAEKNRTGLSPHKLMIRFADNAPNGLIAQMVRDWARCTIYSARQCHLDFVLSAYAECEDAPAPIIRITPRIRKQVSDEAKRTDLGGYALLNRQQEIPTEIYALMIIGLLNGTRRTIREDHLYWILDRYQDEPTRIETTEERLELLNNEAERTGIGFYSIMEYLGPAAPAFPHDGVLYNWSIGHIRTIRQDLFEAIIDVYSTLSDKLT